MEVKLQVLLRSILEVSKQGRAKDDQVKLLNRQQKVYYDCTKSCVNTYRKLIRRAKECLLNIGLVLWNLKRINVTYSTKYGTLIFYARGGD